MHSKCNVHLECTMHVALCTLHYAHCNLQIAQCTLQYDQCTMHIVLCTLHYAHYINLACIRKLLHFHLRNLSNLKISQTFFSKISQTYITNLWVLKTDYKSQSNTKSLQCPRWPLPRKGDPLLMTRRNDRTRTLQSASCKVHLAQCILQSASCKVHLAKCIL